MILPLESLCKKYNIHPRGVIQAGAHYGEEWGVYNQMGIRHKVFFEADPVNYAEMIKRAKPDTMWHENLALGASNGTIKMHTETRNQGQSNTLLEPGLCLEQYPDIVYNGSREVKMIRLDDYHNDISAMNLLVMDVEGYELEVLKGATETLKHIDAIMLEVSSDERYKGQALVGDIDEFLKDFIRVETDWAGINWGDAFYIRATKIDYNAVYINRTSRKDRLKSIQAELKRVGIKAQRFVAVEPMEITIQETKLSAGEQACFESHVRILKKALADKKPVLIFEDDAVFDSVPDFKQLPGDWELCYLGYDDQHPDLKLSGEGNIRKGSGLWCLHGVLVNHTCIPHLLMLAEDRTEAIDHWYVEAQKTLNTYAFAPVVCRQNKELKSDLR